MNWVWMETIFYVAPKLSTRRGTLGQGIIPDRGEGEDRESRWGKSCERTTTGKFFLKKI